MIVVLAYISSAFAQGFVGVNPNNYDSYWSFNYHDYTLQQPFVAAIAIDGQTVSLENNADNWSSLEVAAFITNASGGEECRANMMWLTDEYVLEYGDPYLTIDGFPIYYDTPGGTVYFKMYDHANNIEYTECTITYEGAVYTFTAGNEVTFGWGDGLEPVILNFTSPAGPVECAKIVLDDNGMWTENFDTLTTSTPANGYTGVSPECWTWTSLVSAEIDTVVVDTMPQVFYYPASANSGDYSLRMWHRGIYAMPELDENIEINKLGMGFYVRQPYWFYTLQVGVMDNPTDPSTFVPVAYVDNGSSTNLEWFSFDFTNYHGEGRYIAFKNVIPDVSYDVHSTNYIDDIMLITIPDDALACDPLTPNQYGILYSESFENFTTLRKPATGVEPKCWELVQEDVEMTDATRPQIYYKSAFASEGNYSLRMVNRGVYAMPELDQSVDMTKVEVSMNLRQPNTCYQLEVGVWEDQTQTFVPLAVLNNNNTGIQYVYCSLGNYNGSSHRIAFRNSLNSGAAYDYSYNYIDELGVRIMTSEDCYGAMAVGNTETFDWQTMSTTPATGRMPDCWEIVEYDVNPTVPTNSAQIYYKPAYAYNSDYSFRMVDRCVVAMPEFEDAEISQLHLSMYLRQPVNCYQLEVGVWEFGYDENQEPIEQFVPVATFNNADDAVTFVECDFSNYTGNGGRIAFRNTLNGGAAYTYSYNYIDEVHIDYADIQRNNASNESVIDEMGVDKYLEIIVVYPNPTVGELHIGAVDVQKVECYNQMGQLVAVYDNESNISLNSLANGVYTLRITVPQGVTMRKVVKE